MSAEGCVAEAGLAAECLACRRGGRLVFSGLSFQLSPGGALVLSGPNGSGKSSLLRVLAGLLPPLAGRLFWQSQPVEADSDGYRRAIAYVGHLDAVKPTLSTEENLAFWASLMAESVGRQRVETALAGFGLAELAGLPGRYLSAGQRRRLSLARLLLTDAQLWLLDEPTVALDAVSLRLLEAAIAGHRAAGGLVVLATHAAPELSAPTLLDLGGFTASQEETAWLAF